jgi:hypothetical protein
MARFPAHGPVSGHVIRISDRRARFGDPEEHAAECSCGWNGAPRNGTNAERLAKRDATTTHVDRARNTPPAKP